MPFKNRIRLPFYLSKPQFPVERNVFRKADGSTKLLSAIVRNTYEGKTDQLPEDWHRKLVIALTHDQVTIEDNRLLTDVVIDGDYSIDWQDFLNYPVAQSEFKIQVTPFNATNSNCQSCADVQQLDLVDDTTTDIWTEGNTYEFPFSILLNDTICCYPFIVEIASYNTNYFDSVTVTQAGIVTAVVKSSVPNINGVWVATYRVTCPSGAYDEANIYANISGTSTECVPPTNLQVVLSTPDNTFAEFLWTGTTPPPGLGYEWYLYLQPDIYTAVQSGLTTNEQVFVSGLVQGGHYLLAVRSACDEVNNSTFITTEFYVPVSSAENCGNFLVTFVPPGMGDSATVSYMDCSGRVQSFALISIDSQSACMMMDPVTNIPTFFTTSSPYVSYSYQGLC